MDRLINNVILFFYYDNMIYNDLYINFQNTKVMEFEMKKVFKKILLNHMVVMLAHILR